MMALLRLLHPFRGKPRYFVSHYYFDSGGGMCVALSMN